MNKWEKIDWRNNEQSLRDLRDYNKRFNIHRTPERRGQSWKSTWSIAGWKFPKSGKRSGL